MSINKELPYCFDKDTGKIRLYSPATIPNASGYLWNQNLLLNVTCRGFANSHFMQPEPASYSAGPALAAKTFLQPEHYYYQGHPGRFFYIKDEDSGEIFSLPFEPMCKPLEAFQFEVADAYVSWRIYHLDWLFELKVTLPRKDVLELWQLKITNKGESERDLSIFPCFSIGYQSWMNQSAKLCNQANGIVADKVSPYQKLEEYQQQKDFKELTFLCASEPVKSYCANLQQFLGDGGWTAPDVLQDACLPNQDAVYETPVAVLQHKKRFAIDEVKDLRFIFGAATDQQDIQRMKDIYFNENDFLAATNDYQQYLQQHTSCLEVKTPDAELDNIINHWLPRQVYYHGDVNRLTTDPQTRNYLQDAMGMCYLQPGYFRQALLKALAQQQKNGAMPDGILLHDNASLKYINQVPHADPCVWLPICLQAYISETGDLALLEEVLPFADSDTSATVLEHLELAMQWLQSHQDHRHLSLIQQGDWCDPMNMVGHLGKGVSSWLSMATSWAFQIWSELLLHNNNAEKSKFWSQQALTINRNINTYFWHQNWYGRGITDAGRLFGTEQDSEGKIYLNPQSWAILSRCASAQQQESMLKAVSEHLHSPHGVAMLTPAYTAMVEDIGRLTQKFPGVAENGSLYNHAAAFYLYALYEAQQSEKAFYTLKQIVVTTEQAMTKQQLPNFVPNYYRGAHALHPKYGGLSSRLFNTGTIAWLMRSLTEQLFGLKGCPQGLLVQPQLPAHWQQAGATRRFRGYVIKVRYERRSDVKTLQLIFNEQQLADNLLETAYLSDNNDLLVLLPSEAST